MQLGCRGVSSTFDFLLHGFSDGYIVEDSPTSSSSLVLHVRDSVPNRSDDGSISCLVCVCVCVFLWGWILGVFRGGFGVG